MRPHWREHFLHTRRPTSGKTMVFPGGCRTRVFTMVFTRRQKNHGRPQFFCILQHTTLVVFSAHSEPGHAQADRPMYPQSGSRRHAGTASRMRTSGVVWRGEMKKKGDAGRALASAARRDSLQRLLRAAVGIDHRAAVLQSEP